MVKAVFHALHLQNWSVPDDSPETPPRKPLAGLETLLINRPKSVRLRYDPLTISITTAFNELER